MNHHRSIAGLVVAMLVATACGSSGSSSSSSSSRTTASSSTSSSAGATTGSSTSRPVSTCGNPGRRPTRYDSVVVFAFENRTWKDVGLGFGTGMPYLHALGAQCPYFSTWNETDPSQNSLTQYVGQVTGARQPGTQNDCSPSATCSTRADNVFRQARVAGLQAVNYVEGASSPCNAGGNAAKHVPTLYLWGDDDRAHCKEQVRPLTELRPSALPAFAFVTPTLCNDGHDCDNRTVDTWAAAHIQPIIDTAAYRAGRVAVFVWYDEDRPVPNLWIAPTAASGAKNLAGSGYAGTLAAWESMLGLPCLASACNAVDMRAAANA